MSLLNRDKDNTGIELHDSTLLRMVMHDQSLHVHLDTCVHRSQGTPGVDCGTCWRASAKMSLEDCHLVEMHRRLPVNIWDGTVMLGDTCHANLVPIPLHYEGHVVVKMSLIDGTTIQLNATLINLAITGELRFLEKYS